jgi:hypothetical protein
VTRLGEFSPIGWLFTLGSFLKMTQVADILGNFSPRLRLWNNFVKNGLGYILGDSFTNSSGHPGRQRIRSQQKKTKMERLRLDFISLLRSEMRKKMSWVKLDRSRFESRNGSCLWIKRYCDRNQGIIIKMTRYKETARGRFLRSSYLDEKLHSYLDT